MNMRAKVQVRSVTPSGEPVTSEVLVMAPVAKSTAYPTDGSDEDNSFARWTPSGSISLTVNNPALLGQFRVGQKLYVDFTDAPE